MSNRFHNKFHRENHHSKRTSTNNSIVDASYDPIASYSAPFQGEFYTDGEIVTNSYVQAVSAKFTDKIEANQAVIGAAPLSATLNVYGSYLQTINNDGHYVIRTQDGMGRVNHYWNTMGGTSPTFINSDEGARKISFGGNTQPLLQVSSSSLTSPTSGLAGDPISWESAFTITSEGKVGIGTDSPNELLTIAGSMSAAGNASIGILNAGTTNSVVTEASGTLQKRDINSQVWVVTDTFVTCNTPLSVGYIQKANSSSTLDKSVIYENVSNNIGIGTITPNAKLDVEGDIRQYSLAGNNQMTLSAADPAGTLSYTRYYNSVGYSDIGQSSLGTYINTSGQNFSLSSGASRRLFIDSLNYAELNGNLTITGNLSVLGDATMIETTTTVTSAFSITNAGSRPALIVEQTGNQDVALFKDDGNTVLSVKDQGKVGVNTNIPNHALTVVGSISSTDNLFANALSLSSVTITGEITTSTTTVTASDSYLKLQVNGTTKYLRLFDVV